MSNRSYFGNRSFLGNMRDNGSFNSLLDVFAKSNYWSRFYDPAIPADGYAWKCIFHAGCYFHATVFCYGGVREAHPSVTAMNRIDRICVTQSYLVRSEGCFDRSFYFHLGYIVTEQWNR